ncbi:hypothetical protein [Paraburkholderia sp. HD33-4]|uniref:hypothetical protein n=1 Tax=Paraburkholderia sp. HD33-4 TaxID=2883242 RepID=UPI001F3E74D3|nr:hypothetical protein [Paraburkholderia sp. HD33-4]
MKTATDERKVFIDWYVKRFPQSSLQSAHAWGAWYGWVEASKSKSLSNPNPSSAARSFIGASGKTLDG